MSYKPASLFVSMAFLWIGALAQAQITPSGITLGPSQQQQFSVTGQSQVSWSLVPVGNGTISSTGLYTAPLNYSSNYVYVYAKAGTVYYQTEVHLSSTAVTLGTAASTPVSVSVSPSSVYLYGGPTKQFAATVGGTTDQQVVWSVTQGGGSIVNGFYSAPATVNSDSLVTIAATSLADPSKIATATILLGPAITSNATATSTAVTISLRPRAPSLSAGQSKQFTATVSGTSNTAVTWSLNPNVGTLVNGLYMAPSTVAVSQTVTVTATSVADTTKSATSTIVLNQSNVQGAAPPPPTSVSPATATVKPAGTEQFSVTNLPSGTSVTWSLNPTTGAITTGGLYTAPTTVASQTTVTVTATNSSTQAVLGTASVTLTASPAPPPTSVSPATATVAPSGTQQFSVVNLPSGTTVAWTASPAGSINSNGLFTAPSSVPSQENVTITAKNSSTNAVLGTATLTLTASVTPPSTITMPLEVIGPDGTTSSATFTIPQGTNLSGVQLWMQIHGIKYETEASVQVNNSAWLPISTGNVTILGNGAAFGGIGGGFRTLQMTLNLPSGALTTGTNTVTFRFNGTNGVVSGYRVLAFNLQSGGNNLLPSTLFVNDDPTTWQAPSTAASDIAAGLSLWQGAALTTPVPGAGVQAIQAHCSDCHSTDGRDLKYFNYSNKSIEARSVFHGLTAQQGAQIASYIRSLNLPNPGRPWNPPYQPGPGLDSQPVANWSAGAGLDAVLDSDADMLPYLAPGGSTAGWSPTAYLNARELPTAIQMLDWNSWLPVIHPMDAFGASFTNSNLNTLFTTLRNSLVPNSPAAYANAVLNIFPYWGQAENTFLGPIITNATNANWPADLVVQVYSTGLWQMVKTWELNQEFGLEAMPQAIFGSKADVRGWASAQPFNTAPNMLHLPASPGIGNGSALAKDYLTLYWYHLQLVLDDGQGQQSGHSPVDYGYVGGFVNVVFNLEAGVPGIGELLTFQIKDLQEVTLTGIGPQAGAMGWHAVNTSPEALVDFNIGPLWSATSPATMATWLQAYTQYWFAQAQQYTQQQYYQGGWASATDVPTSLLYSDTLGGQLWYMLPRLRFWGVDVALTDQISSWAANLFPLGNWTQNNAMTCTALATWLTVCN